MAAGAAVCRFRCLTKKKVKIDKTRPEVERLGLFVCFSRLIVR